MPSQEKLRSVGLLILRIGIGTAFLAHGLPKLLGGPDIWERVGGAMGVFGITFAPAAWGLLAALSEAGGGLLLILGLFARPAAAFLAFTMLVAMLMHVQKGDGFREWSHAAEALVLFVSLVFIGAGRFSLDRRLRER